jgi:hypothetical protein
MISPGIRQKLSADALGGSLAAASQAGNRLFRDCRLCLQ